MPVIKVSPKTHPRPKLSFFHLVDGTKPFFSSKYKLSKTLLPKPNLVAVTLSPVSYTHLRAHET